MAVSYRKGAKIDRWEKALNNPAAALKVIGAKMVSESQAAFKNQRFGDKEWKPRAVPNVFGIIDDFDAGKSTPFPRRFEDRPALVDSGVLKSTRGIAATPVGRFAVEVGSNLSYAAVQHHGGPVESKTITETIQLALGNWLLKVEDDAIFKKLGFLLNKKWRGKKLEGKVPARPFVGITKQTIADVKEAVGVKIFEVR